jgi:hypothetical protein
MSRRNRRRYARGDEWKGTLEPWARAYRRAHMAMTKHLGNMSDERLAELLAATEKPSQTNCGWATYGAAQFIRGEVRWEIQHRAREAVRKGPWVDRHGDVWRLGDDGLMHTPKTIPFSREYVEKKRGPLVPASGDPS